MECRSELLVGHLVCQFPFQTQSLRRSLLFVRVRTHLKYFCNSHKLISFFMAIRKLVNVTLNAFAVIS
jgi:hypothetical protein